MADVPTDLISLAEACKLIPSRKAGRRLHIKTLYRWALNGRVRAWKIQGSWFVSKADMLALGVPNEPLPDVQSSAERRRSYEEAMESLRKAGYR